MAKSEFFKEAFDQLATAGCIGDPHGVPAYAYLRVSSAGQAEEGRSGLPRQVQHCHEIASVKGLKIPWELVFADDHSGFEFDNRPELSRLREEYRKPSRRANAIVFEYLDRLSRNADWHQGFLLDEMKQNKLSVVFWKEFSSRIERAVMGAISQDGMEQAKQRMAEGNIFKAKDHRITARVAAYGYLIVDRNGKVSAEAKKDSHYALHPDESVVVKMIYRKLALDGWPLRRLAKWLDDNHYPCPQKATNWNPKTIAVMIRNSVYKGEFIAHRYVEVKVLAANQRPGQPTRFAVKKIERPCSEWIRVEVPRIVSPELWDAANRMLYKNAQTGRRHAQKPYLLTGLVKCATCDYAYIGRRKTARKRDKSYLVEYYRCSGSNGMMGKFHSFLCPQSQISCRRLDSAVWKVVSMALLEPEVLISSLERSFAEGPNAQLQKEIEYLEKQIGEIQAEDDDLYRAYRAKAFDEQEYAARRDLLKDRRKKTEEELTDRRSRSVTLKQLEFEKQRILRVSKAMREQGLTPNPPFEMKQTILKMVVDRIKLNVDEGWFELEGIVPGHYTLDDSIESNSMGMGSSPRPA